MKPARPKWAVPTAEYDTFRVRMKQDKHLKTPLTLNIEKAMWESLSRGQGRFHWVGDTCEYIRFLDSDEGLFTEPCFVTSYDSGSVHQPHPHLEHVRAAPEEAAPSHEELSDSEDKEDAELSSHLSSLLSSCLSPLPPHTERDELPSQQEIANMTYEELLRFAGGYERDILEEPD